MLCNNKLDQHAGWALCCVENIRFVFVELTENDMNNLIKAKISIWLRDNFQNLCVWFICSHAFRIIRRSIKQFQPCVGLTDLTYKKCGRNLLSHATAKPTSAGTPTKKSVFGEGKIYCHDRKSYLCSAISIISEIAQNEMSK